MSAHTPGPWSITDTERATGHRKVSSNRGLVAWVGSAEKTPQTFEANARLISAAPDLLEALKNTLALAVLKYGNLNDEATAVFDDARAAIARATLQDGGGGE